MEHEIHPVVLQVMDRIRSGSPIQNITDVIIQAGVSRTEARAKASDWAWALAAGGYLLTIWAEGVRVHPKTGHWFYVDTLETATRRGGLPLGPLQEARAKFRVECLRKLYSGKEDFGVVLQINELSREDLLQNKDSVVKRNWRVRDEKGIRWHVASWDEKRQQAVLVRGPTEWVPITEDIDGIPPGPGTRLGPETPDPGNPNPDAGVQPKLWFPDQAHRDRVEKAAIERVTKWFEGQRFKVRDVSPDNLGYDLVVSDATGRAVRHVEVKGTSSVTEGFFLTRNERRCSVALPTWRLAVVTMALNDPELKIYSAEEMEDTFKFEPLAWRCDPV